MFYLFIFFVVVVGSLHTRVSRFDGFSASPDSGTNDDNFGIPGFPILDNIYANNPKCFISAV